MSSALRDQRGSVYGYSDVGSDGRAFPAYTKTSERWCRLSLPTGRETLSAGQAGQRVDGVIEFSDEASIPKDGIVGVGGDYYRVTAVLPQRGHGSGGRAQIVLGVFADDRNLSVTDPLGLEDGQSLQLENDSYLFLESAA